MHPAIFLDKDGTLIHDVPYNVNPSLITLAEGVRSGVQRLHSAGFELIVITNQSGVARGYFPESALPAVRDKLESLLEVSLTGFYYCPHHPQGTVARYATACECRKPEPGLLLKAAADHAVDLSRSWMIGDILNDVEAGHRAGCRSVLIDNGNETEWILSPARSPEIRAANFTQATNAILHAARHENISSRVCSSTGLSADRSN
ncbi:MAG: HAD family hydrolase [Phormidesmis sp.]